MASAFLYLADGRCFAVRWAFYDETMRAIAEELCQLPGAKPLYDWLQTRMPGPNDEEELGYGAFFRVSDQQVVVKSIDTRGLTPENQKLFHEAAKRAGNRANSPEAANWDTMTVECLRHLADLVARTDRGEPPLNGSGMRQVLPFSGECIGPGWPASGKAPENSLT